MSRRNRMRRSSPGSCVNRWIAAVTLLTASIDGSVAAVCARQGVEGFDRWAKAQAIRLQTVELGSGVADLRRLKPIIGAARVVALGEPAHGAHEPLAFRNRLFRYLVEELGFTAIAIESGLPESRPIFDFVASGQGSAAQAVRGALSCGADAYQENEELAQWMREYNANPAHDRKIRFYALDLGRCGEGTPVAFDKALTYFTRVDPESGRRMRTTLQPYLDRLSAEGAPPLTPAEQDGLSAAIDDLISPLERERPGFIAATSETDYEWAHRNAVVARQANRMSRARPTDPPGQGIPPSAWRAMNVRDAGMADNVRWVLEREGADGRVLVFAHNAHIMNAGVEGGPWSSLERPPYAMGRHLRQALGAGLVIIGTSSAQNGAGFPAALPESGSLDAALARVGAPRFLLDLRAARADRAVAAWLAERRALRANFATHLTLSPSAAFDALLFIDTLTPAHTAPPR